MKQMSWTVGLACFAARVFGAVLTLWVNPFIGTMVGSGNAYHGAHGPFGMISWSPQTTKYGWSPSGYNYGSDRISGFGLIHYLGRGEITGETREDRTVFCTALHHARMRRRLTGQRRFNRIDASMKLMDLPGRS